LDLNQLFAPAPVAPRVVPPPPTTQSAWPRALAEAFAPPPASNVAPSFPASVPAPLPAPSQLPHQGANTRPAGSSPDIQKLRAEIIFLDSLVKKLQAELQNERQYNQSLETQIRALTQGE
jgi:hypothetical protein